MSVCRKANKHPTNHLNIRFNSIRTILLHNYNSINLQLFVLLVSSSLLVSHTKSKLFIWGLTKVCQTQKFPTDPRKKLRLLIRHTAVWHDQTHQSARMLLLFFLWRREVKLSLPTFFTFFEIILGNFFSEWDPAWK